MVIPRYDAESRIPTKGRIEYGKQKSPDRGFSIGRFHLERKTRLKLATLSLEG